MSVKSFVNSPAREAVSNAKSTQKFNEIANDFGLKLSVALMDVEDGDRQRFLGCMKSLGEATDLIRQMGGTAEEAELKGRLKVARIDLLLKMNRISSDAAELVKEQLVNSGEDISVEAALGKQ